MIATFGSGQVHQNCYVEVPFENYAEAHNWMMLHFKDQWANLYSNKEDAGVERWNLKQLI